MLHIEVSNFDEWRSVARKLIQRGIKPDAIAWQADNQAVFFAEPTDIDALPIVLAKPTITRHFIDLAFYVSCYRDASRWALLYSLLWRLVFEDKYLLNNAIDPQVAAANKMRKTIGRDKHKMEAFVRFQRIDVKGLYFDAHANDAAHSSHIIDGKHITNTVQMPPSKAPELDEYFMAWFEPEHLILPVTLPFFVKRFANMHWSILTPDECVHWDCQQITVTPGLPKGPKIDDGIESLWLEYYKNIFNPARLKVKAMQSEMPKKYWQHLPEAVLIKDLIRDAQQRTDTMINTEPSADAPKASQSSFVQKKQHELRRKREQQAKP